MSYRTQMLKRNYDLNIWLPIHEKNTLEGVSILKILGEKQKTSKGKFTRTQLDLIFFCAKFDKRFELEL